MAHQTHAKLARHATSCYQQIDITGSLLDTLRKRKTSCQVSDFENKKEILK